MATVNLTDIVEVLEWQYEGSLAFVDMDTGEAHLVSQELLGMAEESEDDEEPDLPKWQEPEWQLCKRIASSGSFVRLPTKYDIHEWEIMRDFTDSVGSARLQEDLSDAIHGAGAFRHFRAAVERRNIQPAWRAFYIQALKEIAIDWCEEEGVAWQ